MSDETIIEIDENGKVRAPTKCEHCGAPVVMGKFPNVRYEPRGVTPSEAPFLAVIELRAAADEAFAALKEWTPDVRDAIAYANTGHVARACGAIDRIRAWLPEVEKLLRGAALHSAEKTETK